jgi:hypothetical protein
VIVCVFFCLPHLPQIKHRPATVCAAAPKSTVRWAT